MKTVYWQAAYTGLPKAVRYCKKCAAKTAFVSSNLFRMNAQKRNLDVWLIYKCERCGCTWNMTVHTRIKPQDLPPEHLRGYEGNDPGLARQWAMNIPLLRQNGAEVELPDYEVTGEDVDIHLPCRIHITNRYPMEARLGSLLCGKLGTSRSRLAQLLEEGELCALSGQDLSKDKLTREVVIELIPKEATGENKAATE